MSQTCNFVLDAVQRASIEDVLDFIGFLPEAGKVDEDGQKCAVYFLPEEQDIERFERDGELIYSLRGATMLLVLVAQRLGLTVSAQLNEPGHEVITITS